MVIAAVDLASGANRPDRNQLTAETDCTGWQSVEPVLRAASIVRRDSRCPRAQRVGTESSPQPGLADGSEQPESELRDRCHAAGFPRATDRPPRAHGTTACCLVRLGIVRIRGRRSAGPLRPGTAGRREFRESIRGIVRIRFAGDHAAFHRACGSYNSRPKPSRRRIRRTGDSTDQGDVTNGRFPRGSLADLCHRCQQRSGASAARNAGRSARNDGRPSRRSGTAAV